MDDGDYAQARAAFDKAIAARADTLDPFYRRAGISILLGDAAAALPDLERTVEVLRRIERNPETKPFFDMLVAHAMQGFYGDPRHGGNRERVSWKMLGVASPPLRGRA